MQQMDCTRTCWITGAIAGLLVWLCAWVSGGLPPLAALLFGLITLWFVASFLIWGLCRGAGAPGDAALLSGSGSWTQTVHPVPLVQRPAESLMPQVAPDAPSVPDAAAPATGRDDQTPPAAVQKAAIPADTAPAPSDAEKPGKKAGKKAGKDKDKKAGKDKAKADKKAARAKKAKPDDLKQIKGIGPKLEKWLVAQGLTRFADIAALDDAAQDELAEKMGRMGARIRSDDWVGQARLLAQGGQTAFSKRVEKGGVYE